jgi:hypothetical protein
VYRSEIEKAPKAQQRAKEQYRVEISITSAAFENLDFEVEINRAWETNRKKIKISARKSLGYH